MKLKLLSLFFALFLLPFVVMGQCGSNLFVNDADGNSYATLKVGPHCWMQSNLKTRVPGSSIYRADMYPDTTANLEIYGRLYNWYAAMNVQPGEMPVVNDHGFVQGVCPEGWHLPNDVEVAQLMTNTTPALHDVHYWLLPGTNTTNYTMRPGGYYNAIMNRSENLCGDSYMWTAQSLDESSPSIVWSDCHCDYFLIDKTAANNGMSVRCVHKIYQGTVTTDSATNITDKSATLYGTVAFNGYDEEYERGFVYGTSSDNLDQWVVENQAASEATAPFNKEITGLSAATTYYYQAYVVNDFDTAWGEIKDFTTLQMQVSTDSANTITHYAATLHGNLIYLDYASVNAGFKYGTGESALTSISEVSTLSNLGQYSATLEGLAEGTTYFFKAFAANGTDTVYGNVKSFTTKDIAVAANAATNVQSAAATLNGELTKLKGYENANVGFRYGQHKDYMVFFADEKPMTSTGSFDIDLSNISPNTTYFFQAYAYNETDTAWAVDTLSFRTLTVPCLGAVRTNERGTTDAIDSVIDNEGNAYIAVKIGNQCWMAQNLRTQNTNGYGTVYTNYDVVTYGRYYTWTAMMQGSASSETNPSGVRGICPEGWHIPSLSEWRQLSTYVKDAGLVCTDCSGTDDDERVNCIPNALASTIGWKDNSQICTPGCKLSNKNATGFSAVPAGYYNNAYLNFGEYAIYFMATTNNAKIYYSSVNYNNVAVHLIMTPDYFDGASSVRCLRDPMTVTTDSANTVTKNSAKLHGTVTSLGTYANANAGFKYGTSESTLTSIAVKEAAMAATGLFSCDIDGLTANTTYYFKAFAANGTDTVYGEVKNFKTLSINPCPNAITVTDHDNNTYNTIQIGNQCWMAQNLRTNVGSGVYPKKGDTELTADEQVTYGRLYTWDAMMSGSPSTNYPAGNTAADTIVHGICPTGWHVPSDAEWTLLTNYVSSQSQYVCDNDIAKALASTTGWNSSTVTCAVGKIPDDNNKTGFSALPAGYYTGSYEGFSICAYWWSATEGSSTHAYYRGLGYGSANVYMNNYYKSVAFSVRCLRDAEVPAAMSVTTDSATTVTKNGATLYGNVTSLGTYNQVNAGFKYGTSEDALTTIVSDESAMTAAGQFSFGITGLTANTQYYYKAFAANGTDTVYGEVKNFTTLTDVVTDTIAFLPNGGQGTMVTMLVTRGDTVLNANTYTHGGNWHFDGWNTAADGSGTQYADHASITTSGNLTLYAQWDTWCTGTPQANESGTSRIDSVKDVDNNQYAVVQIGNQCWLKENLRTLTNGAGTGNIYTPTTPGYDVETYGLLYDWAAVMQGKSSTNYPAAGQVKVQGICPAGWHVPSDAEWDTLTYYVYNSANPDYKCSGCSSSGWEKSTKCIAKALASATGWNNHDHDCNVGNLLSSNNATGFSALPAGGIYFSSGQQPKHNFFSQIASFSSATDVPANSFYTRTLQYNWSKVGFNSNTQKELGLSVRCVRDAEAPAAMSVTTDSATTVTKDGATLYGNVIDMGGNPEVNVGFKYGTSEDALTTIVSDESAMTAAGQFSFGITGLTANTQYYYKAFAANGSDTVYGEVKNFTTAADVFTCGTSKVKDIDNNEYNTVQIGTQCWMKENLRTTKYANGTAIEEGTSTSTTNPYRYAPNGNESNVATYGYLYNWVAVMNGASSSDANPSGVQGICPVGWHVPSNAEWTQLTDYVSSQSQYECGNGTIAKALASTTGWNSSTVTCAVGNIPDDNNKTGFSALPAGYYTGSYDYFGDFAYFWSATEDGGSYAYYRGLYFDYAGVHRSNGDWNDGFSVRCLRDAEAPAAMSVTTDSANTITKNSAKLYGNVTDMGGKSEVNAGFKYGTSEDALTTIVSNESAMTAAGQFSFGITGLAANTQYYYKAFAANGTDTVYGEMKNFTTAADVFTCGTSKVKDIDNNEYKTVQIGTQCWMKENLRTTKYANGTAIEVGTSTSTTNPYRYAPSSNESNVATYGYLYNWKAVMDTSTSSDANPSGVQGICPTGWHVPSDAEWTQLTDYVSSQPQYVCGDTNINIAKALASTTGWNSSSSDGCNAGNTGDKANATGFAAVPAGNNTGSYGNFGNLAFLWSATEGSPTGAYYRGLYYNNAYVSRRTGSKYLAFSVRCLRDAEVPAAMSVTTDSANTITKNSATLYGNVTSLGTYNQVNAGFKYGTSEDALATIVAKEDAMTATGLFSCDITGLTANTQYYYKAFAANGTDTVYGEVKNFTTAADVFTCGTSKVKDIDNNEYKTVPIGNQCWMAENLRTTKYANGTAIEEGTSTSTTNPYRYAPNGNEINVATYGYLYNWKAVMDTSTSSDANPSGVQGICPVGWHVPSDAEWTQLTDYVSNQSQYVCGNNTIAKALASKTGWNSSSSTATCAVGYSPDDNNKTGFSALPAGAYDYGYYNYFGDFAYFWSATEDGGSYAYYRGLYFDYAGVHRSNDDKYNGFSVRCLRDK